MTLTDLSQQEALYAAVDSALKRLGWPTIISTVEHETMQDRVVMAPLAGPVMVRVAIRPTHDEMMGLASVLAAQDFSHVILFSQQLPFRPPHLPRLSVFQTTPEVSPGDVEAALRQVAFAPIA